MSPSVPTLQRPIEGRVASPPPPNAPAAPSPLLDVRCCDSRYLIDTIMKECHKADPSITDFIIHQDEPVRVTCARDTLRLDHAFPDADPGSLEIMQESVSKNAILSFVVYHLMGARTTEEVEKCRLQLQETLRTRNQYEAAMRLSWGAMVRVALFPYAKGRFALVGRVTDRTIRPIDSVGLPHQAVATIRGSPRGIVLITGPMNSGKTSTARSILNHRNWHHSGHIVTIEDPIETDLTPEKSIITAREVGVDVPTFQQGLRFALRQAADTLFVGELRDGDTIAAALSAAGSGLFVVATTHGDTCVSAIKRMAASMGDEAATVWSTLSSHLLCVVRQAMVPQANGRGWVVAADALLNRGSVPKSLATGDVSALEALTAGGSRGEEWVCMNDSLNKLVSSGSVRFDRARRASTHPSGITSPAPSPR